LSSLYRTKASLILAELLPAWAKELAADEIEIAQVEQDLTGVLIDDIVHGYLDDKGPLKDDLCVGVRFIKSNGAVMDVRGHQIGEMLEREATSPARFKRLCHRIVVMREAVLDFARRRELAPPSWWSKKTIFSTDKGALELDAPSLANATELDSLRPAPDETIRKAIEKLYNTKKAGGEKPPNVKELGSQVLPLLAAQGYTTSARRIEQIGGEAAFKRHRRKPGRTLRSERAQKK
jgi:hypothetical protein